MDQNLNSNKKLYLNLLHRFSKKYNIMATGAERRFG